MNEARDTFSLLFFLKQSPLLPSKSSRVVPNHILWMIFLVGNIVLQRTAPGLRGHPSTIPFLRRLEPGNPALKSVPSHRKSRAFPGQFSDTHIPRKKLGNFGPWASLATPQHRQKIIQTSVLVLFEVDQNKDSRFGCGTFSANNELWVKMNQSVALASLERTVNRILT